MNTRISRLLICLCVLALASTTAFAANKNGITTSQNGRRTIAPEGMSKAFTPYVAEPDAGTIIFNNLGQRYPLGVYWCCTGATISGPASIIGTEYREAAGFTPSANATVTNVKVGVGYVTGSFTDIILSVNADNGGVPGVALARWKLQGLPTFGTCCTVTVRSNAEGIPVSAGTLYWVVLSTEANSDVWGAWNLNDVDQVNSVPTAYYTSGIWTPYSGVPGFAFAVAGN